MSRHKTRRRPPGEDTAIDLEVHGEALLQIVQAVRAATRLDDQELRKILRRHPRGGTGFYSKSQLVAGYRALCDAGEVPFERETLMRLQLKPVRSQSGVAPVSVLTKPAGCPGQCIFCPNDPSLPKSYLPLEPGAQRALRLSFDPYQQTRQRVNTFHDLGHATDKVELIILGGTWSAYPKDYATWFVKRCLDALNGRDSATLPEAQQRNEQARHRCVGLAIETRPDWVTLEEVRRLRYLGVTRVQVGVQSLDDRVLSLNRRGHDVAAAQTACRLLRAAGFKIHLHWMPNLLGATPTSDREDFRRLWQDPELRPDELKIYPCSLLEGTDLYQAWEQGQYEPYDEATLTDLLADCKTQVPPYCRLSRVVRDIPANYIAAGNRFSNLREAAQERLITSGRQCRCIRCREIRGQELDEASLRLREITYDTGVGREHFLSYEDDQGRLAGFLRLLLPWRPSQATETLEEVQGSALIREIHVYGPALRIGAASQGEAQHTGIGSRLLEQACLLAGTARYQRLSVIAAVGTRGYYRRRGFQLGELYMHRRL